MSSLEKGTFGCPDLADLLERCEEVEICGVTTNICVIANAVIARIARPEARVFVRKDYVANYDRVLGEKALDVINRSKWGCNDRPYPPSEDRETRAEEVRGIERRRVL